MWREQVGELADILLDSFDPNNEIMHYDFSIENLRILDFAGSKALPKTDPTILSIQIGGNYKSGALLSYEVKASCKGEISELDYFKQNLYPLLKQYHEKQDHTEVFKHLAYLEYFWDKKGMHQQHFRPTNSALSQLRDIFSSNNCYCNIGTDQTRADLNRILAERKPASSLQHLKRIDEIKIFSRFGEPDVFSGYKEGPLFDRQVIESYFRSQPKIMSRAHKMIINFRIPYSVETA